MNWISLCSFFCTHFLLFLFKENSLLFPFHFRADPICLSSQNFSLQPCCLTPNGLTVFVEILTAITFFWSFPVPQVSLSWSSCPEVCSLCSGSQPFCQVPFPGSILIPTFLRFLHSRFQTSHIDTSCTSYQMHLPAIPTQPVPGSSS